ncbi:MAG TPA: polysaccharide deacetylase family protein [Paludibacteraceae bacterium]|jgi:peptidoglycan/xylan/chitin deacetylase (PgdA/CDA1 family)|nr:polysaccharide deacetylase family protein [Paludibacteraceae bacterium]
MLQVPEILKSVIKNVVWRINPAEKVIYLTFDDGPNSRVTPLVLDILDRFEVKATFFCVGENVSRFPDVFDEVKRRGHTVGNHTFNHLKGFEYSTDDYVRNVKKASEFIDSRLFRPPHGQIKPSQIKALKDDYLIIMWDFITYDYDKRIEPEKIIAEVKKRSRNGSIVVFHDSLKAEKNVLQVLPEALRFWKENGYEVCHI